MILVDTSVIVAWLDPDHDAHVACTEALEECAAREPLAVSSVTYAELAAGARTQEAVDEALEGFQRLDLDFAAAWRAGQAFRQFRPAQKTDVAVLPDFFIRAQAATQNLPHLTHDRRRIRNWPDVEFEFV
jgi:predicted nucleic acid-binding protein